MILRNPWGKDASENLLRRSSKIRIQLRQGSSIPRSSHLQSPRSSMPSSQYGDAESYKSRSPEETAERYYDETKGQTQNATSSEEIIQAGKCGLTGNKENCAILNRDGAGWNCLWNWKWRQLRSQVLWWSEPQGANLTSSSPARVRSKTLEGSKFAFGMWRKMGRPTSRFRWRERAPNSFRGGSHNRGKTIRTFGVLLH